jgi:predicted porin
MKKSLLALAILGAFAGAASAQSSVTIYGIVDTGIARIDNGGDSVTQLKSGNNNSSRIGFKGVEDLGNGLKASFVLENGINTDDGTSADASSAFSRLAYVGLEGDFGAVRLGRQNSQIKTALAQIDPFETGGLVNAIGLFTGGGIPERVSNQITYTLPNMNGFQASVGYVFGETAGSTSDNNGYGLQLGYANGPLNVQFAYNKQNTTAAAAGGGFVIDQDTGTIVPGDAVAAVDQDVKNALLGVTYDFGGAKLHAAYGEKKPDNYVAGTDVKVKSALIGVTVPFGASKIRAEYIRNNDDRDDQDSDVWAFSYTYSMSKRTTLYATYARIGNDDKSKLAFGKSPTAVAGENASGVAIGVQHNF